MSQWITIPFPVQILLEASLIVLVTGFNPVQHTRVLNHSFRREWFQRWGKNIFLAALYVAWVGYKVPGVVFAAIKKWSSPENFFHMPIVKQLPFYGLVILYLSLGAFFVWPALRSYVMPKVHLDPQLYTHRVAVWWMFSCLIDFISTKSLQPPMTITDFWDFMTHHQVILFSKLSYVLLAILAVGGGSTRNGRETLIRLGLHRQPTKKGILWVALFKGVCVGFMLTIAHFFLETGESGFFPLPPLGWSTLILLAIAPAIGEELFFRGAFQPRVGIWITSILFTMAHSHYGWYGLLGVFLNSLLYGWAASRYSIWLSIGLHALHNFVANTVVAMGLMGKIW
ncbi:CPBP family intramembrane glutamic endopeptidase [Pasteuria penetrans]|uniref:CPBP family intramembrane glutamic endopeptidase n=1 Tax=Pasteuria penetrans TaxID=86005 RepID=UPI000FB7AAA0|nr:type II CAAX endopeptidase family protein [Pasteuria penetrans]